MKISKSQAERLALRLADLQGDLLIFKTAIQQQDFEKAAKVRDFLADKIKKIFKEKI